MTPWPSDFEHSATSLLEIRGVLAAVGAELALLKLLPKNANDKNQIYIASDFGLLYDNFDVELAERGDSVSLAKRNGASEARISEAAFRKFYWRKRDGVVVEAKRVKAIIYPQYPEARLSGLQTVENTMPQALSVTYTKENPAAQRLLVLGRLPGGHCVGIIYINFSQALEEELACLPSFERARSCKRLAIELENSAKLEARLADVLGKQFRGARLDAYGRSMPFSGTQVCGYTLEHALGIVPNSAMDGDLYGIELKTHTQLKVTLFTPEPDGGHYVRDFPGFMKRYGYLDSDGAYRLTGVHRANVVCGKTGLTLRVREQQIIDGNVVWSPYDPSTPLTSKLDLVDVALIGEKGEVAASWSLARLMNCWGAKHNEVVYIQADKVLNPNLVEAVEGYEHLITFERTVMWCRETSAERLLAAINDGVIYLDPAPKFYPGDPAKNKRRCQWRVNDITKAATSLYSTVNFKTIGLRADTGRVPVALDDVASEAVIQQELFI